VQLLREARERQGLSKYAVEQKAGVSQQMVGYVERGLRKPSLEVVVRIATALGFNLSELFAEAGQKTEAKVEPVAVPSPRPKTRKR
jgi:transcriptional regulator with XRE-family HTH domain